MASLSIYHSTIQSPLLPFSIQTWDTFVTITVPLLPLFLPSTSSLLPHYFIASSDPFSSCSLPPFYPSSPPPTSAIHYIVRPFLSFSPSSHLKRRKPDDLIPGAPFGRSSFSLHYRPVRASSISFTRFPDFSRHLTDMKHVNQIKKEKAEFVYKLDWASGRM